MHPDETMPRRSLANSLATYLHQRVWSSPMCLMAWLPSQRSQPQDRVETTGSIWKSKPYINIYSLYIVYKYLLIHIYIFIHITSLNMVDMFVHAQWENDNYSRIYSWWLNIYIYYNMLLCWFMYVLLERPTMPTLEDGLRSWPTWLSARSPRNRPQEVLRMLETLDSRCWPASDPAEKTKKLNAEIANGRLAMMAIIGMFFQAGMGFCAHIVCYNSTRKETPQRVWLKECNNAEHQHNRINIGEERSTILCQLAWRVLSLWSVCLASHVFSPPHVWLFGFVLTAIFTHMLASKVSCSRMCREWVVSWCDWCDMHRLYHRYNAFEACTKTCHLQIWWLFILLSLTKLYVHIVCDYKSYRAISCHIISNHIISVSYHIVSYCTMHIMSYLDFYRIINNLDTATLRFWSLP